MPRETLSDRDLAGLLDEQIDAMQALLASLDAERKALSKRDGDALLKAVSSETASVETADALEQQRQDMMKRVGIPERQGGGRVFSADAGLGQRWQQVVALTEQCRALNEGNGQIIRGQRRRVDGALRVLRGEPDAAVEYGPGGESRSCGGHRSLASY